MIIQCPKCGCIFEPETLADTGLCPICSYDFTSFDIVLQWFDTRNNITPEQRTELVHLLDRAGF